MLIKFFESINFNARNTAEHYLKKKILSYDGEAVKYAVTGTLYH